MNPLEAQDSDFRDPENIVAMIKYLDAKAALEKLTMLEEDEKLSLDLSNTDGNAYSLLGAARTVALGTWRPGGRPRTPREDRWTKEMWKCFLKEAKSKDYDHLLVTLMRHFNVSI